jgi:hypothetical protein
MMSVLLKVIYIDSKTIKPDYVLLHNRRFAIVTKTDENETTMEYPDGTTATIPTMDARILVAKFIAQMEDLRTYPVAKSNFKDIVYHFNTAELCDKLRNHDIKMDGTFRNILVRPEPKDLVELTDAKIADKYGLTKNRLSRIGIIKNAIDNYKYNVMFDGKTIPLSREQFANLDRENTRQIFELHYDDK